MADPVTHGLVLGYGSVGRRHAAVLANLVPDLVIVESREAGRSAARDAHPKARVVECLAALDGDGFPWEGAAAVIATWGPSHAPLFHELADRGVRRVLCEKPLAASVRAAYQMADRATNDQVVLAVHHFIRYARLAPGLAGLATRFALGDPVKLVVQGGAGCLLTNGVHWIDFAMELFGAPPLRVVSSAYGERINPRSPDLCFYGGTAVWSFGGQRELVISLTNRSSIALTANVLYRDAIIELDGELRATVRRRDPGEVQRYPAVTRCGEPSDVLFEGFPPGARTYADGMRCAQSEVVEARVPSCTGATGAAAVAAGIASLVSARDRQAIRLPIHPQRAIADEEWPIS